MNSIVTVADSKYVHCVERLLKSIPTISCLEKHVVLVDVEQSIDYTDCKVKHVQSKTSTKKILPEYKSTYLNNKYTCYEEQRDRHHQRYTKPLFSNLRLMSEREMFCLYTKYKAVKDIIDTYDNVLLVDADTIVNGDIQRLFAFSGDVSIPCNDKYKYKMFHEDVTVFRSNTKTKKFIGMLCDACKKLNDWQADQLVFRNEYYENIIGVNFNFMSCDVRTEYPNNKVDSIIWANMK